MTDDAFREPPWMCHRCGYLMDAAFVALDNTGDSRTDPADGDLSLCMNCGAPFHRVAGAWQPMTPAQVMTLGPVMRRDLALGMVAIAKVRRITGTDLAKRGGRA